MHDSPIIVFLALLTFLYGLISKLSERSLVTAPMVFVGIGTLVGPLGLDLVQFSIDDTLIQIVAEITLVSILFVEASSIDLKALLREGGVPARLLLVGLPLSMLLGTLLAAWLFPDFSWWLVALLAFILAPTDAALGQAVVTSPLVPEPIRRAINVESGINDGMVLPPILVCIAALAGAGADQRDAVYWVEFTVGQLVIGPLAGAAVGWFGGLAVNYCSKHQLMNQTFQRLSAIALAILSWGLAEELHGNGYIAAFFGGLLLNTHTHAVKERIQEFGEAEGQQLALFVFLIFGLAMVPAAYPHWSWESLVYALLSLTVIRMLPVMLSLTGTSMSVNDRLFIGWFGPRGIASVLYLEMVIVKLGVPGFDEMLAVIVLTVLLSVFLHGATAVPLARRYRS